MRKWIVNGLKMLVALCTVFVIMEVVFRVGAYAWNGSEYFLFYGFHSYVGKVGISPWSTFQGEYYKFPPNYVLHGADGQGTETASTNAFGFRGPAFAFAKPAGVFRVVCLGESSTFGYHNADDETYPVLLERRFSQTRLPVQVVNAGFPYYNSGSILSLFRAEILPLQPDLITLYAGYNDTSWPMKVSSTARAALWTQSHSITYMFMRTALRRFAFRVEQGVLEGLMPQRMRADELLKDMELVAQRYRKNVQAIIADARSRNIEIVLIRQPVTARAPGYEKLSYEAENETIRRRFERDEPLTYIDVWMLKQRRLTVEFDQIAREANLTVVDNVKIVDQDRRRLASWVHLTAEGNERLAEALEAAIRPYVLRTRGSGTAGDARTR
jgi:lysophospholipase L1-like esterase